MLVQKPPVFVGMGASSTWMLVGSFSLLETVFAELNYSTVTPPKFEVVVSEVTQHRCGFSAVVALSSCHGNWLNKCVRSVIADVAKDQGGCVETLHLLPTLIPTYVEEGVVHYGVPSGQGLSCGLGNAGAQQQYLFLMLQLLIWDEGTGNQPSFSQRCECSKSSSDSSCSAGGVS